MMDGTATVKVYDNVKDYNDWPPKKLVDAIAWLQDRLDAVPPEYRGSATFEIDGVDDYGDPSARISIKYRRPMTSQEIAQAEAEEDARTLRLLRDAERQAEIFRARLSGRVV